MWEWDQFCGTEPLTCRIRHFLQVMSELSYTVGHPGGGKKKKKKCMMVWLSPTSFFLWRTLTDTLGYTNGYTNRQLFKSTHFTVLSSPKLGMIVFSSFCCKYFPYNICIQILQKVLIAFLKLKFSKMSCILSGNPTWGVYPDPLLIWIGNPSLWIWQSRTHLQSWKIGEAYIASPHTLAG